MERRAGASCPSRGLASVTLLLLSRGLLAESGVWAFGLAVVAAMWRSTTVETHQRLDAGDVGVRAADLPCCCSGCHRGGRRCMLKPEWVQRHGGEGLRQSFFATLMAPLATRHHDRGAFVDT
jgi:hypothetical protein